MMCIIIRNRSIPLESQPLTIIDASKHQMLTIPDVGRFIQKANRTRYESP